MIFPSGASPRRLRASCRRDSASSADTPHVRARRDAAITPLRPVPPVQWMYSLSPAAPAPRLHPSDRLL